MEADRDNCIPLSSISVTEAELGDVWAQLRSANLSGTGPAVAGLESLLRQQFGRRFAVATNSGTSALDLALEALDVGPGDEVILPGFTFAAPASAVIARGATPILCDVDDDTWTLTADACGRALSSRSRAVIAVDVMGNPCDFSSLIQLPIPVIEDAAEAIGGHYLGRPCGSFGIASILSFHANKAVSAGEGGMILTDDQRLADKIRLLAHHGMGSGYVHVLAGHNYRMANLTAAFALAQARRSDVLIARRLEIEAEYRARLRNCPLRVQLATPGGTRSVWLVCFRTQYRDALVRVLRSNGIDARAVWPSLDAQPFLSRLQKDLPISRRLAAECLWLPTFHDISIAQIERVAMVIVAFFNRRSDKT